MVLVMILENIIYLGDILIICIYYLGMVTLLYSNHFQWLPRSTTIPHLAKQLCCNQTQVQARDFEVMGHWGNHNNSPNVVLYNLKLPPLYSWQDKYHQHLVHWVPQALQENNSVSALISFSSTQLEPPCSLPMKPPKASHWTHCCRQQSYGNIILHGVWMYMPNNVFHGAIMMWIICAITHLTWAVQNVKPELGWSKLNYLHHNLLTVCASPTSGILTSGRMYGYLGFRR